jgi:hypothetical protein
MISQLTNSTQNQTEIIFPYNIQHVYAADINKHWPSSYHIGFLPEGAKEVPVRVVHAGA